MKVAFLGHDQLPGSSRPAGGYLSRDAAALLIHELAAEKISNSVIRAFSPESKFQGMSRERLCHVPLKKNKLPPKEVGNCKFVPPQVVSDRIRRTHYLPRFHEVFGDWQLATSVVTA